MPGRKYSSGSGYRYGFNGKEKADEIVSGDYAFEARIYDPRIGRFLSVDPRYKEYSFISPYSYAANNPISLVDRNGEGPDLPRTETNPDGEKQVYQTTVRVPRAVARGGIGTVYVNETRINIPSGTPVTKNLSEKEIYQLIVLRKLNPGEFKIGSDQYLDAKYFEYEEKVDYYFSHLATATMPNTEYYRNLTTQIHTDAVVKPLLADDENADAAVTMINRRTSFFGKFNWGKAAVSILPFSALSRFSGASGISAEANFAQKTFSSSFSAGGKFAGKTVDELASLIKGGEMNASQVPIQYVVRDGQQLILNTRSAAALTKAGIPRSQWNAINVTGNKLYEKLLTEQLKRNGLTNAGTATTRQSGTTTTIGPGTVTQ